MPVRPCPWPFAPAAFTRALAAALLGVWLGLGLGLVLVLGTGATPAAAHTGVVATVPEAGTVLARAPEQVTLTFGEPVTPLDGSTLFVPDGTGVEVAGSTGSTAGSDGRTVTYRLPARAGGEGSHALAWRVLARDGHVVTGTLAFAVGVESDPVGPGDLAAGADAPADAGVLGALRSLAQALTYVGVLLASGLAWSPRAVRIAARCWLRVCAGLGALGAVAVLLLARHETGLRGAALLDTGHPLAALLVVAGCGALTAGPLGWRLVGGAAAALGLAVVGHPRGVAADVVATVADVVHVLAAGVWVGGLLGLLLVLRAWRSGDASAVVGEERAGVVLAFSRRASWALLAVAGTGSVLAQQVLGGWSRLVTTDHGRLLLVKVALVLVAIGFGAWHRRRLARVLPGRRALTLEVGVLLAVVLVSGFLSQASPRVPLPTSVNAITTVDDVAVEVRLVPGVVGANRVELRVRDAAGLWVPLAAPPQVVVTGPTDEPPRGGAMREHEDHHALTVQLPEAGTWRVQVPVKLSRFAAPVVAFDLDVVTGEG